VENSDENFYVSGFTLHSIEVIMSREGKTEELREFLNDVEELSVKRLDTSIDEEADAVEAMREHGLDFDDAIQHQACEENELEIISYDTHFDGTEIKRREPGEVNQKISRQEEKGQ
jgi:predicted nucleic acid-binding protein